MCLQVLGQAAKELSDVDEIHLQQHVLKQTENPQRRPKEGLLAIAAEHVPNAARHVQGEGLAVEREDPGKQGFTRSLSTPGSQGSAGADLSCQEVGGGSTLDGSPAYHRADRETTSTLTHTYAQFRPISSVEWNTASGENSQVQKEKV